RDGQGGHGAGRARRWRAAQATRRRGRIASGGTARRRDRHKGREHRRNCRRIRRRRGYAHEGARKDRRPAAGAGGSLVGAEDAAATASPAAGGARPIAPATGPRSDADYEDVALTQIRKTIARRLSESIGPIPTFYLTAEFDLTRVVEMREAMLELGEEFKVSINDILLKAVATALAQHPEVNAHWLGDR